jgi:hypothetical protein
MADVLIEILDALVTPDPTARATARERRALYEAQASQDQKIEALEDEVAVLASQVRSLQRTVATLTDLLLRSGTIGESDRDTILRAARRPRYEPDPTDDAPEEDAPAVAVSPYRGATPIGGSGCAICGKALAEDDPELTLAARGKVCTLCFTRGG